MELAYVIVGADKASPKFMGQAVRRRRLGLGHELKLLSMAQFLLLRSLRG